MKWTQNQGHWIEGRCFNEAQDDLTLSRVLLDIWKGVPKKKPLRVGVSLSDLVLASEHQHDFFDKPQNASLTKAIDELNEKFGKGIVCFGVAASASVNSRVKLHFSACPIPESSEAQEIAQAKSRRIVERAGFFVQFGFVHDHRRRPLGSYKKCSFKSKI